MTTFTSEDREHAEKELFFSMLTIFTCKGSHHSSPQLSQCVVTYGLLEQTEGIQQGVVLLLISHK